MATFLTSWGELYDLKVEVAFASGARATSPSWVDVTSYAMGFSSKRGRSTETDLCEPGETAVVFRNDDGIFDNDNPLGAYAGNVVENRRVRVSAKLSSGSTRRYLGYAYADSWTREWPDGWQFSVTNLKATDRFKLLAKRQNTGTTVQEQAHVRLAAILNAGDTNGPNCIVPTAEYSLNPDGYACRTLVAHVYTKANTLDNLREVALSDGGALFVAGDGVLTFQSTRFRTDNTRSTVSQGVFGNTSSATVSLPADAPPKPANDEVHLANYVTVTDARGKEHVAQDATSIAANDRAEFDIGGTLLRPADAPDRAADVLLLRKSTGLTRYDELVIDAYTSQAAMSQALDREISDRITLAFIPAGQTYGTQRDYYIESIAHEVTPSSWRTTFRLSPANAGTAITSTLTGIYAANYTEGY